jgi:hypothetical protein
MTKPHAISLAVAGLLGVAAYSACGGHAKPAAGASGRGTALSRCEDDNRPHEHMPAIDFDQRGPDPALTDLMWALSKGDTARACRMIVAGANVNAPDRDGVTALWIAAAQDQAGVVGALLAAGADANATDHRGATLMCDAAQVGSPAIVKELLEAGAGVNRGDRFGIMPLMCAGDNAAVVRILLTGGRTSTPGTRTDGQPSWTQGMQKLPNFS